MNPFIRPIIERLREQTKEFETLLEQQRADIEQLTADKEESLKEQWRAQKEASTLRHSHEEFVALQEENDRLEAERSEIRERLRAILQNTKALASTYRE